MRILYLAFKDISQILRDRRSLIFLILMPIGFTLFMGFAYRSGTSAQDPRLLVGWLNNDEPQGKVVKAISSALEAHPFIRLIAITSADLEESKQKVRKGELAGILVIPAGFSQAVLTGANPQMELYADELTTSGQSVYQSIRGPITRVLGAAKIASLTAKTLDRQKLLAPGDDLSVETGNIFPAAAQTYNRLAAEGATVVVQKAETRQENIPFGGNPYNQSSPGILTMFALFGLVSSANVLVQERKTHTLQRMMTTSMSRASIIAGHLLANFLICFCQIMILVIFGQLVLNVDYLRQPAAILMVSIALSLWVAAVGLTISVYAQNDSQVVVYSLIIMFVMSALGGAWFPLDVSGAAFASIGRFTPTAWVMTGYQNILIRGLSLSSVWQPVGILLAYAAAFFLFAIWSFSRRDQS